MIKHFSATVYVIKIINGEPKVLLHLHKKHNAWYGLGGHVEENEDPVEAVKREAMEEAQMHISLLATHELKTFKYANEITAPEVIMDQDINGDHRHIDFIYFGTSQDDPKMNEPFKWFSSKDIDSGDLQEDTRYIVGLALDSFLRFTNTSPKPSPQQ